jgi:hypothetical protein
LKVAACAKGSAFAGEDNDSHLFGQCRERLGELGDQLIVERILDFGPVKRHMGDAPYDLDSEHWVEYGSVEPQSEE